MRPDEEPPEWAKRKAREIMAAERTDPEHGDEAADTPADTASEGHLPDEAVEEAERLTRLAREATDPAAARSYRDRRDALVEEYDYTPRLREEDDTLVLYPSEWVEGGTVQLDRVEDTDRAVEVSLSGPGDADRYREVAAYNDAIAAVVAAAVAEAVDGDRSLAEGAGEDAGSLAPVESLADLDPIANADPAVARAHAENARRFATFMSSHYVRPVDEATPATRAEFREEYLPRNGWPTETQLEVVEESLALIADVTADVDVADVTADIDVADVTADIDVDAVVDRDGTPALGDPSDTDGATSPETE
ncbi:DUF7108 domain-containing protein [Halorubrum vacuolatum]|uniref:RnhA operon protein n=1 Tax=Halorubrum vacuolatum TaxID=63740 RepID=A0A238XJP6_HALVU|nr:hypothetical protein SAMN06264855_11917 [Halorubrum vacuolatum]